MAKKKLKLKRLKVQSFITESEKEKDITQGLKGGTGNCTGNCGSFIGVTCPEPCDFQSIPLNECTFGCPFTAECVPDTNGCGGSNITDCYCA